jgi:hypothetical protein
MNTDGDTVTLCDIYARRYRAMLGDEIAGLFQHRIRELQAELSPDLGGAGGGAPRRDSGTDQSTVAAADHHSS